MAPSSSDTAFLTVDKSFTYRGAREHWANVYHFDQVPPSSDAWLNLMSAVWNLEKVCFPADVQFESATGHTPGTPPLLVFEFDQPPAGEGGQAGTYAPIATEHQAPGDDAIWVRYGTTQKTSRGKPIYLRNYYHGIHYDGAPDTFSTRQKGNFDLLGTGLVAGLNVLGTTYRRAGPRGAVAQNHAVSQYITTRTLKARGRRHRITRSELEAAISAAARRSDVPVIPYPVVP